MARKKKVPDLQAMDCSPGETIQEAAEQVPESTQSRREFLLKAGVGLAAVTAAAALPSQVLGATMSKQEIKAMAGKITSNGQISIMSCGDEYCQVDYCTGEFCAINHDNCEQSVCPINFCPHDYTGDCSPGGDHCPIQFCNSSYCHTNHDFCVLSVGCQNTHCNDQYCDNAYCELTKDNCTQNYCPSDNCVTNNDPCTVGTNPCPSNHCTGHTFCV
jgi:hypothetical protein